MTWFQMWEDIGDALFWAMIFGACAGLALLAMIPGASLLIYVVSGVWLW